MTMIPLTLIVKFLGYELDRLPGKLIHHKIMSTYSVFLKLGAGRFTGKLIQKKAFSRK